MHSGKHPGGGPGAAVAQNANIIKKRLVTTKKRADYGFTLVEKPPVLPERRPRLVVSKVKRSGAGSAAGIRVGDVLVRIAGQDMKQINLKKAKKMLQVGAETQHPVDISVMRENLSSVKPLGIGAKLIQILLPCVKTASANVEPDDAGTAGEAVHVKSPTFDNSASEDFPVGVNTINLCPELEEESDVAANTPLKTLTLTSKVSPSKKVTKRRSEASISISISTSKQQQLVQEEAEDDGDEDFDEFNDNTADESDIDVDNVIAGESKTDPSPQKPSTVSPMPPTTATIDGISLKKPTSTPPLPPETADGDRIVTVLHQGDSGYGLKFAGAKTVAEGEEKGWGILVCDKLPGSASAANDDIRIGWQVLKLGDTDLSEAVFSDLKDALRRVRTSSLEVELIRNDALAAKYNVRLSASTDNSTSLQEEASAISLCMTSHTQHGTRHGQLNQDSCIYKTVSVNDVKYYVAAAFDGHGLLGEQAAAVAKSTLSNFVDIGGNIEKIAADPVATMKRLFVQLHEAVVNDHKKPPENYTYPGKPGSECLEFELKDVGAPLGKAFTCTSVQMPPAPIDYGCTAAVAIIHNQTAVIGSLGDAGAIMCYKDVDGDAHGALLSAKHTASDPDEIERLERDFPDKAFITPDGYLSPIDPHLSSYEVQLTRSLGHALLGQFGISAQPDVKIVDLDDENYFALVLCSDGVTDELEPDDIAQRVGEGDDSTAKDLCQEAQDFCMDTDRIDDCTAVIMRLQEN